MDECVRSAFKVCGVIFKLTDMRRHTKNAHNMTITDHKSKFNQQQYFDLIELVLHKCGICEEYLVLDSDYVSVHLKSRAHNHNISYANYNAKYMILNKNKEKSSKHKNVLKLNNKIKNDDIMTYHQKMH